MGTVDTLHLKRRMAIGLVLKLWAVNSEHKGTTHAHGASNGDDDKGAKSHRHT